METMENKTTAMRGLCYHPDLKYFYFFWLIFRPLLAFLMGKYFLIFTSVYSFPYILFYYMYIVKGDDGKGNH